MSATPIPRTLHMSLLGLRDMSVIETPPKDRLAIHTVVAPFTPDLIKSAIELELARGGQVYFVHNRIDSIWQRAAMIQEMFPQVRIGVGHGQMAEAELEKVMLQFMRHEFDVFVSTTIVENGLDIPLANTMIIEHAERYGLSELYQLRGRVGRSNRRAYCYLLIEPDTELTEVARKRLAALKEFSAIWARASRLRRSIWNCAARAICWAASSTAISTRSASICISGCWKIRCANCAAKKSRRRFIRR